jgi:AcrR family transcriptional regulator
MTNDTTRHRPGGRTARTAEAVRRAVVELVAERGSEHILVADVAARSGVHAATIYRRWGTPESLVLDVALDQLEAMSPIPDTGSLRGDVLAYARRITTSVGQPDGFAFLRAVIGACKLDHSPGADGVPHLRRRGGEIQAMLDRATDQIHGLQLTDVFDGILAPIYFRTLLGVGGIDDAYLNSLVDRLLTPRHPAPRHC